MTSSQFWQRRRIYWRFHSNEASQGGGTTQREVIRTSQPPLQDILRRGFFYVRKRHLIRNKYHTTTAVCAASLQPLLHPARLRSRSGLRPAFTFPFFPRQLRLRQLAFSLFRLLIEVHYRHHQPGQNRPGHQGPLRDQMRPQPLHLAAQIFDLPTQLRELEANTRNQGRTTAERTPPKHGQTAKIHSLDHHIRQNIRRCLRAAESTASKFPSEHQAGRLPKSPSATV